MSADAIAGVWLSEMDLAPLASPPLGLVEGAAPCQLCGLVGCGGIPEACTAVFLAEDRALGEYR